MTAKKILRRTLQVILAPALALVFLICLFGAMIFFILGAKKNEGLTAIGDLWRALKQD